MKKYLFVITSFFVLNSVMGQKSITAYIFMAEECPVCNYISKSLKKVSEAYKDDVDFVAIFPQKMSNYKTSSQFKTKYGLEHFKIHLDHDLALTKKYNGSVTPEVVIVNKNDEILYQGRINNSYAAPGRMRHGKVREDLDLALKNILRKKPVAKPWPAPIGCFITK